MADSVASFVKLWSGNRSDQAGRRKGFIVFGYCVPALVRPLISMIVAPWQLFGILWLPVISFLGWFAFVGIYLAFALGSSAWQAWVFFLGYGLVCGLMEPAEKALVAHLVGSERKGLAYRWYNFAIGIAVLPSSLIFGALHQVYGALVAFGWGAGLALIAVVLLVVVNEPDNLTGTVNPGRSFR
jgi:hypothetical protein